MQHLQICMFGGFSLQAGDTVVTDSGNRARKVWLLLAALLCHRGHVLSPKRLIELTWGDASSITNPENTLRITLHRARTLLNHLWPTAGHDLILFRDNGYVWNDRIPVSIDSECFEALCTGDAPADTRLENYRKALSLYRGGFLEKLSSETWIIPISTHFHNLYLATVLSTAQLLADRGCHQEAAALCRQAAAMERYHEPLYQILIRELAASGNPQDAAQVYADLNRRLFRDFGIHPSEQTRAAYRAAVHSPGEQALPLDTVLADLQEPAAAAGALQCDYDYFKFLCYAHSRTLERSGSVSHVALLCVSSDTDIPLSRRTLNRVMEQLGEQIRVNIRRGDAFSQCSSSQYILLLPDCNQENSCIACRRILATFSRKHPHVTARLHYMVQSLTPGTRIP